MAETVNLNIRIDRSIKEQAELFFAELGMSISTAVSVFMRQALRQGKIPFEISLTEEQYSKIFNTEALRQSISEAASGKLITMTLDELRAMEE